MSMILLGQLQQGKVRMVLHLHLLLLVFLRSSSEVKAYFVSPHFSNHLVPTPLLFGYNRIHNHPRKTAPSSSSSSTITTTTTALSCQLLGMNCAKGLEFALHWPSFCERGGGSDIHADGWGLAYYDFDDSRHRGDNDSESGSRRRSGSGHGLRQFHDVEAASTSKLAQFLTQQNIQTSNMMAHIRYATTGAVDLANVHPFSREMWGLNFAFCHNGEVPLFEDHPDHWLGEVKGGDRFYSPVGSTDSEALFCAILNALRSQFVDSMPSLPVLYESLRKLAQEAVDYDPKGTILNFLLTTGPHVLWVYSWPGSRPGSTVWNGLNYIVKNNNTTNLVDDDYRLDVTSLSSSTMINGGSGGGGGANDTSSEFFNTYVDTQVPENPYCIVATKPLTDDGDWIELQPGELILFDGGLPHVSPKQLFRVDLQGHGLDHQGRASIKPPRLEEDMRRYELQPEFFVAGGI